MDRLCSPDDFSKAAARLNGAFGGADSPSLGVRLALGLQMIDGVLDNLSTESRAEVVSFVAESMQRTLAQSPIDAAPAKRAIAAAPQPARRAFLAA